MKKLITILIFPCMANFAGAQFSPSLDEIINIALCKDSTAFKKAAEKNGLYFVRMKVLKELDGYFIEYYDPIQQKDGTHNKLTWIVYHKANAPDAKHADYTTTDFEKIKSLEQTLDERKYDKVDLQKRTDEKNRLMTGFFYKKGNTGVQTTFSTIDTKNGQLPQFSISVIIGVGINWPKEK